MKKTGAAMRATAVLSRARHCGERSQLKPPTEKTTSVRKYGARSANSNVSWLLQAPDQVQHRHGAAVTVRISLAIGRDLQVWNRGERVGIKR